MKTFQIKSGVIAIFDTAANTGYLVNEDASYLPFLIASGQKRYVNAFGGYYAETPSTEWVGMEFNMQPKGGDFGKGRFIRLSDFGTRRTRYGIHSAAYVNKWLQESSRYKSLGCIIVSEEILDIVEQAFIVNNRKLEVITTKGSDRLFTEITEREHNQAQAQKLLDTRLAQKAGPEPSKRF